ncbi:MAG TPA: hypothetical protein PKG48_12980, partial [Bacteroidales bacterium]|nr:hypothetical protein [Bacteroidales bacterium]
MFTLFLPIFPKASAGYLLLALDWSKEGITRYARDPRGGPINKKPGTSCLFFHFSENTKTSFWFSSKRKNPLCCGFFICGERGIRTPGPLRVNGFQDRRN